MRALPGKLHLFPTEGFGGIVVEGGLSFVFLYEIQPVVRAVFPKVRPAMRSRPDPAFGIHPEPESALSVRLGIDPAEPEVIDPSVGLGKEGTEPGGGAPTVFGGAFGFPPVFDFGCGLETHR